MQNAGLDESQAGTKTARRNINNLRYADDTTLTGENEEEWRASLKLNIQKTKNMASGHITSWQINVETVTDFILGGVPKSLQMVTAAMKLKDVCSLEEKIWPT